MSRCYAIILTSRAVGGLHWQKNSDNSFTSTGGGRYYSDLDLYLMGMIDKTKVSAMTLIENASIDPAKLPEPGATITGTARTVTIDDIVAAEGERIPSAVDSPKAFKVGYILITTPDTFTGSEPAKIEDIRSAWAGRFASLTGGKGSIADVAPSLTVSITSPADNATITGDSVTVTGAIINTSGSETGVTVNGVPATVYGTRFVANNVPLEEGSNTITVTAMDAAGNTATTSITVTATTDGSYIQLIPNIESGISPLTVTFRIDGSFSVTNSQVSVSGPGKVEWLSSAVDEYTAKITGDGVYTFTATVTGPDESTYQVDATITVLSRAEMDRLLKAKWEGMKGALLGGDIEIAINSFVDNSKDRYRDKFTQMGEAKVNSIFSSIGSFEFSHLNGQVAECRVIREESDGTFSYPVTFVLNDNGIWQILGF